MRRSDSVERFLDDNPRGGRLVTPGQNLPPYDLSVGYAALSIVQDDGATPRGSMAPQYSSGSSTTSSASSVFSTPSGPAVQTSPYSSYGFQPEVYSNSNRAPSAAIYRTSTSAYPSLVVPDGISISMASHGEARHRANYTPETSCQNSVASDRSISLGGSLPPYSQPGYRELEPDGSRLETRGIPCIFQAILSSSCDEYPCVTLEAYHEHILGHFGTCGPPKNALCMFCGRDFQNRSAYECWREYIAHMWDHLCNGNEITNARPDFLAVSYLRDKCIMSTHRYEEYCRENSEDRGQVAPPGSTESPEEEPHEISVLITETPTRKNRAKKEDRGGYNDHNGRPSPSSKKKDKRRK